MEGAGVKEMGGGWGGVEVRQMGGRAQRTTKDRVKHNKEARLKWGLDERTKVKRNI